MILSSTKSIEDSVRSSKKQEEIKEVAFGQVINNYDIGVHSIHWIFLCNAHQSIENMD
jgi:hypothetical protein